MTKPQDLRALAQAAIVYAQTVAHTQHCQEILRSGYTDWRNASAHQHTHLVKGDANWKAMMTATTGEYQNLRHARDRERRAQKKLLALAA